ncbi:MAG: class I SAM-dependent methyltransferase, partial [Gammaproteobacteria bacterium]|nr:class I SAM-dependent methyltransferase [Gammaproteobacteria bacterium]
MFRTSLPNGSGHTTTNGPIWASVALHQLRSWHLLLNGSTYLGCQKWGGDYQTHQASRNLGAVQTATWPTYPLLSRNLKPPPFRWWRFHTILEVEGTSVDIGSNLPKPSSVTHSHLLGCINTELARATRPVRILDAGCGDGRLLAYLHNCLRKLRPNVKIEFYGYDVVDHGVQTNSFESKTLKFLEKECPEVNWAANLRFISANDSWPFESDFFDFVVSNQVLEHVQRAD